MKKKTKENDTTFLSAAGLDKRGKFDILSEPS